MKIKSLYDVRNLLQEALGEDDNNFKCKIHAMAGGKYGACDKCPFTDGTGYLCRLLEAKRTMDNELTMIEAKKRHI